MVDLADIVREEGQQYLQSHFTTPDQRKAMRDIVSCRTETMGTVSEKCEQCGAEYQMYRSCRNRSCPLCGGEARQKWLEARRQEILPVEYLQVVRAAGEAVMDVGWSELGVQLGCLAQLQTWGQNMALHVHAHCVVPCGGFSEQGSRWVSFAPGDLPDNALASRFQSLLCKGIRAAAHVGKLDRLPVSVSVERVLQTVKTDQWRVYAKPPFGGVGRLLEYLSRYTYRVAMTNDRIESYQNHQVTFWWRDYRQNKEKLCTVSGQEFMRRFLKHVPPSGFVRIRSYGFLGNRNRKTNLARARQLIGKTHHEAPERQPFHPLRLCPACYAGRSNERKPHFAPSPEVASQIAFTLRPPPIRAAA